jgi:hypothetical protein
MNYFSESYELAQHIHYSFLGLNPDELADSGILQKPNRDRSSPPDIFIDGEDDDGKRIRQTLYLGQKAVYCLRTTNNHGGFRHGGPERRERFSRWPDVGLGGIRALRGSLFMLALEKIESERAKIPELETASN